MTPRLLALGEGPDIPINRPIVLIGRHAECDIQIPSRKISRRHCCIAQVHDYLVIRDLESTNGIRINGQRVNEGKLQEGDQLTIGNATYQVDYGNKSNGKVVSKSEGSSPPMNLLSGEVPVLLVEDHGALPAPRAQPVPPPSPPENCEPKA